MDQSIQWAPLLFGQDGFNSRAVEKGMAALNLGADHRKIDKAVRFKGRGFWMGWPHEQKQLRRRWAKIIFVGMSAMQQHYFPCGFLFGSWRW